MQRGVMLHDSQEVGTQKRVVILGQSGHKLSFVWLEPGSEAFHTAVYRPSEEFMEADNDPAFSVCGA